MAGIRWGRDVYLVTTEQFEASQSVVQVKGNFLCEGVDKTGPSIAIRYRRAKTSDGVVF